MNPDKQLSQLRSRLIYSNSRDAAIIKAWEEYGMKMEQLHDAAITILPAPPVPATEALRAEEIAQ